MLVLSREAGSVLNLVKSDHIGVAIDNIDHVIEQLDLDTCLARIDSITLSLKQFRLFCIVGAPDKGCSQFLGIFHMVATSHTQGAVVLPWTQPWTSAVTKCGWVQRMPDLIRCLDGFIFLLQVGSFWNHCQEHMVHFLLLIEVSPDYRKPLLFSHERVVLRDFSKRRRPSGTFAEAVMQEKVGNRFWGNVPVVPGVSRHDVTQDMDPNTNWLSLDCVKIKAMEHKAQKHLDISRADTRGHLIRQGIPLKQIAFRKEVLPFGIGACWSHHRNLSMSGFA